MMWEYFCRKDRMMIEVVKMRTRFSMRSFWKVPASWSAWQCVRITAVMCRGWMPWEMSGPRLCGGGSTTTPRPYIHTMNPVVAPLGSKPWEDPSTVTPKSGGSNGMPMDGRGFSGGGRMSCVGHRQSSRLPSLTTNSRSSFWMSTHTLSLSHTQPLPSKMWNLTIASVVLPEPLCGRWKFSISLRRSGRAAKDSAVAKRPYSGSTLRSPATVTVSSNTPRITDSPSSSVITLIFLPRMKKL
mmetsp:Transcript_1076/g.3363  ORF Transcript_1076/g.3363 Transcript_1076/m.3363 type:complete len:241 (-) Transcript_1076:57-779(-)